MKTFLISLTVLLTTFANAGIMELNKESKTLSWYPTPALEFSLMDLGKDGGYLTISLNYENGYSEYEELSHQYPGYEITTLSIEKTNSTATLEWPDLKIQFELPLRNNPSGPYLNYQEVIPKELVQKLKRSADLQKNARFYLAVAASIPEYVVLEQTSIQPSICNQLKAHTIEQLLLSLSRFKKPEFVRHTQTFEALKKEILNQCFQIPSLKVDSFKELLAHEIQTQTPMTPITATYIQKTLQRKEFNLQPDIQIQIK